MKIAFTVIRANTDFYDGKCYSICKRIELKLYTRNDFFIFVYLTSGLKCTTGQTPLLSYHKSKSENASIIYV